MRGAGSFGCNSPVFGEDLLTIGEVRGKVDKVLGLGFVFGIAEFGGAGSEESAELLRVGAFGGRLRAGRGSERKRSDETPVSGGEHLRDEVAARIDVRKGLRVAGIEDAARSGDGALDGNRQRPIGGME